MAIVTETEPVMAKAKQRGRPRTSERDDTTVRIDRTVVGKAKLVAAHRGVSVAELLTEMVRQPLDVAFAQMVREINPKR